MPQTVEDRHKELHARLQAVGQDHVFTFWDGLDTPQRQQLLDDLQSINVAELPALARKAVETAAGGIEAGVIEPAQALDRQSLSPSVKEHGCDLLSSGKVAALTVAGGQGTRFGLDGPKGAVPVSPVKNKPLFQLFAEAILSTDRRYGCHTQWYIMTCPSNDEETRAFFREHAHFGMIPERVTFFQQGVMPAFDQKGKILLDQKHHLALAPDGHGGTLLALARNGMLDDMAGRGIEFLSYFQVDNPLVACLDPVFIGLHDLHKAEISNKSVPKADDLERVGNFAMVDDRLTVIEYSDLPPELAASRNADGSRRFDAGSIAVHLLSRTFVERLTANPADFALPWHRAVKKIPYVDLTTGDRIEPNEPNAFKLESFVFDALSLAHHAIVMETSRAEEFSPVKQPTGVDSLETARRDMSRRAARWLESAGMQIPRNEAEAPDGTFEISPLRALDAAHLAERELPVQNPKPGAELYIE